MIKKAKKKGNIKLQDLNHNDVIRTDSVYFKAGSLHLKRHFAKVPGSGYNLFV